MTDLSQQLDETQVDRIRELTSIGAGHAANALAAMTGRPCSMRVPTVRVLTAQRLAEPFIVADAEGPDRMGVFFELHGGPGGYLALIFPGDVRDRLVDMLTGGRPVDREMAESALRELGNILVSHVASSIGETTGAVVLPSVPDLVLRDAGAVLAERLTPHAAPAALRIETEIADRDGEIHGLLVYVPDRLVD